MAKRKTGRAPLPREVSRADLARVLGYSVRRIGQFCEQGVLERTAHGTFDLAASVQKLVAHQVKLAETAAAKAVAAAEGDREYDQAKARWMVEKAEAAKLLRQSRDGELVPADEVQSSWDALVINARTILLAIPSRVAAIWSTIKSPADAERIIREFIEQALSQLAAAEFVLEDDNANGNGASPASLS